jgi:hypothetical protein
LVSLVAVHRAFELIGPLLQYRYAQWLVEDPQNHDYSVIASVIPDGATGYDVAHRTGVIGQVFRLRKSIVVPDVRNHPLYDPFESEIDWELCFPVFNEETALAVINFEGVGTPDLQDDTWNRVWEIIGQTTSYKPEPTRAEANNSPLVHTQRIVITPDPAEIVEQRSAVVEAAKAIARGGESTLLVGDFDDLLHGRGPTMDEAIKRNLDASYCFFGVEQNLDLIATGPTPQETLSKKQLNWWSRAQGRYAFVILNG